MQTTANNNQGVISLTPQSGSGTVQQFTLALGTTSWDQVQLLINAVPLRLGGCNVAYKFVSNTLYLYNDDGSDYVGSVIPGSSQQVSNRCSS